MKCPRCGTKNGLRTDWKPSRGLDPKLAQYECANKYCETIFYLSDMNSRQNKTPPMDLVTTIE